MRFTDAELMAEGYKAQSELCHWEYAKSEAERLGNATTAYYVEADIKAARAKRQILHRFATLPHYDDQP